MANESVRPRIMDFLEARSHFVHVGGIAKGAQVSTPSVRKVLAELEAEGRLENTRDIPGASTTFGYRLRRGGCSRCGEAPAPHEARSVCDDCDPGTMLCKQCYVVHAGEVLAEASDEPATEFRYSSLKREKLGTALDVVTADALAHGSGELFDFDPSTGRSGWDDWGRD
jgi:hypothetical protein